jgi:hypothetical protein
MPDNNLSQPPEDIDSKTPVIALPLEETPSIFFVSLPKSGTVYTWYSLQDMTGLKMPDFHRMEGWHDYNSGRDFSCPELYACGDYNTQLLIPKGMQGFLKGYIFGSHMQASHHNLRILKECGIDRISVLLRDPRDAFVSWVHHLNKLGPSARNYHSKIYHIPRDYYGWTLAEQFAYQIRNILPVTINWVEGWLDYYASENKPVDVLFVYYDELKRNPERYIGRITEFHGIENVDFSKTVIPEPGRMHFRKGEHEQWRVEFTPADIELVDNLLGDRILRGFEAAAKHHPRLIKAKTALERNDLVKAADSAYSVVKQFPNFRQAYNVLIDVADRVGCDCILLQTKLEEILPNPSIANCFKYHQELVDVSFDIVSNVHCSLP